MVLTRRLRCLAILLAVLGAGGCKDAPLSPLSPAFSSATAGSVRMFRGAGQTGLPNDSLAELSRVEVRNADNTPQRGLVVTWTVSAPGSGLRNITSSTNASGIAVNRWQLGSVAGAQILSIDAGSYGQIADTAFAIPAGSSLSPHEWLTTSGSSGSTLQPHARLTDDVGNAIAGVRVLWSVVSGAGAFAAASSFTDANGIALQDWQLGPPGFQSATASVPSLAPASFAANSTRAGDTVAAFSGNAQVKAVGVKFDPFVLRATDADGAPLAGLAVRWSIRTGTATLKGITIVTDAAGKAQASINVPAFKQLLEIDAQVEGADNVTFAARVVDETSVVLQPVITGLDKPLYAAAPPGDARFYIAEQDGVIRVLENGAIRSQPFLNLRSKVLFEAGNGLLSFVFHPQYQTNGYVFVNYTGLDGNTKIERYTANPANGRAELTTAKPILNIAQPYANHHGGHMLFGPDGFLYIPLGDGGDERDPENNGQNPLLLVGKLLRIDVNVAGPYAIPHNNPHVGDAGWLPEIWAAGLRNPWRFAFDGGWLYLADVGQNAREEINIVRSGPGGYNFGWRIMEGSTCFDAPTCDQSGLTLPVAEYTHAEGCSVTGGFVYRGAALPELVGTYFYADYCAGWIRSFRYRNGVVSDARQWSHFGTLSQINSFGVDGQGELYVVRRTGTIYRFTRAAI